MTPDFEPSIPKDKGPPVPNIPKDKGPPVEPIGPPTEVE